MSTSVFDELVEVGKTKSNIKMLSMKNRKKQNESPKKIENKQNDNDDVHKVTDYLEIDPDSSDRKIIQRIEHLSVKYFENGFAFNKYRLSRRNSVWDVEGRIRIKKEIFMSNYSVSTSHNHAAMWLLISFIYVSIKNRKTDEKKIREVFYIFKDKDIFKSVNGLNGLILS